MPRSTALILALAALGIVAAGVGEWRYSAALDERSRGLDERTKALDQRSTDLDSRDATATLARSLLDASQRKVQDQAAAVAAQQAQLASDRAAWEASIAAYRQPGCTVYVGGHNANVNFIGPADLSMCGQVELWMQRNGGSSITGIDPSGGTVCRGSRGDLLYTVRDTGGLVYGTLMCDGLARWARGTDLLTIATSFR